MGNDSSNLSNKSEEDSLKLLQQKILNNQLQIQRIQLNNLQNGQGNNQFNNSNQHNNLDVVDEEDIEFERYSGREYKFVKMNIAYDNWGTWVPKNPTEHMLKNAIDSNGDI